MSESKLDIMADMLAILAKYYQDELKALIEENVFMMDNYLVDKGDAPVVETHEEQKTREREERRKRMEAHQKGEHLG
jgi:hypothetical protein